MARALWVLRGGMDAIRIGIAGPMILTALVLTCAAWTQAAAGNAPRAAGGAAQLYRQAFSKLIPSDDMESQPAFDALDRFLDRGKYDAAVLDPFLDRQKDAVDLLVRAAALEPEESDADATAGSAADVSDLSPARALARVASAWAWRAASSGRGKRACTLYSATLKLADYIHRQGSVMHSLVAVALLGILDKQTAPVLSAVASDKGLLDGMAVSLENTGASLRDWSDTYECEFNGIAALFPPAGTEYTRENLAAYVNVGKLWSPLDPPGTVSAEEAAVVRVLDGTATEQDRIIVGGLFRCDPAALGTPEGVGAALEKVGAEVRELLEQFRTMPASTYVEACAGLGVLTRDDRSQPLRLRLLPMLGPVLWSQTQMKSRLDITRVAIAVLQYRQDFGALPDTLGELDKAKTLDPFTDQQPFEYRLLENDGFSLVGALPPAPRRDASSGPPRPTLVILLSAAKPGS